MEEAVTNQQLKEFSTHWFSCCGSASGTRTNVKVCLIATGHFAEYCSLFFSFFFFFFFCFNLCGFYHVVVYLLEKYLQNILRFGWFFFFYPFSGGWQS